MQKNKEYKINIDPKILSLLGPGLYRNIYYILAELIANAYDANAKNVYILQKKNSIIVEDDGSGMSYDNGDIERYLNVAVETRTSHKDTYTEGKKRKKMGRKGVGKLAALSVSENVFIMTRRDSEESGFILSRNVREDHRLTPLLSDQIKFEVLGKRKDGTSVVMTDPHFKLHKTVNAIKNNLLKIFPLIDRHFKIHIQVEDKKIVIENFDKEMINGLSSLIVLGEEFYHLSDYFDCGLDSGEDIRKQLLDLRGQKIIPITMKNKKGKTINRNLAIKGWIGAYKSTSGRKDKPGDFPDNFVSLLSNGKLGEFNIIPDVGKNRMYEVYVVGQLHVDLFEATDLPDMALSNRQGYKSDDIRYEKVTSFVRNELLVDIIKKRTKYKKFEQAEKNKAKAEKQLKNEQELREKVEEYKRKTVNQVAENISKKFKIKKTDNLLKIINNEINKNLPFIGIKRKVDAQKKKILISHTATDKPLADIIHRMLSFNKIKDDVIIYTNSDSEKCWIPSDMEVFEYLREYFVQSFSDEKIFVIYVTSENMENSWGAVCEVGACWITKSKHNIFNIKWNGEISGNKNFAPSEPLNVRKEWVSTVRNDDKIIMRKLDYMKFAHKIIFICKYLGYEPKSFARNLKELKEYIEIKK